MLKVSIHGDVESHSAPKVGVTGIPQVALTAALDLTGATGPAGPSSTPTSSNTWAATPVTWYHAASGLWAGCDLNRLREGKSGRGEVTIEANKCPPST